MKRPGRQRNFAIAARFALEKALRSAPADRTTICLPSCRVSVAKGVLLASTGAHRRSRFLTAAVVGSLLCACGGESGPGRGRGGRRRGTHGRRHRDLQPARDLGADHERELRAERQMQRQPAPGLNPRNAAVEGQRAEERDDRGLPRQRPALASRAPRRARTCTRAAQGLIATVPSSAHSGHIMVHARPRTPHELLRADLRLPPRAAPAAAARSSVQRRRGRRDGVLRPGDVDLVRARLRPAASPPRSSPRPTPPRSARCSSRAPTARATSGASSPPSWWPNCTPTA